MSEEPPETSVAPLLEALSVRRNATIGAVAGVVLAVLAYVFRLGRAAGPFAGTRQFPVLGETGWFLLLSFVLASAAALLVATLLTLVSLVLLLREEA
ncbi:DUF7536 family protein [Halolamina salifodinae]|uniref:Uncharacterized protein n=1 Tax=Halolamina salifodinae TaxID=1202767 RepID=A0A8T4H063_9EURY|nr:hypothetical protein [Halolamina salifodinae]MBP1987763.1 hypothetical protein [Halolamina salifodinae]